eukprot:snap_masked-scaffold_3-processed-gene-0.32-mRNA-1 protein AED:1.00 eAED:1.00 QI:0/-1/0/0/-1/1/1/0/370
MVSQELDSLLNSDKQLLISDLKPVSSWTNLERREYMKRAMQKYRKKENEIKKIYSEKVSEVYQLKLQVINLRNLLEKLHEQEECAQKKMDELYLLKKNETLRNKNILFQSSIYVEKKYMNMKYNFTNFNVSNFQNCLQQGIKYGFSFFTDIQVTKHGRILFGSKSFKANGNRRKLRKEINEKLKYQTSKLGKLFLNSIAMDKDCNKILSYTMSVDGVNYEEYGKVMYEVNKTYDDGGYAKIFDVDLSVLDFDSRDISSLDPFQTSSFFAPLGLNLSMYKENFNDVTTRLALTTLFKGKDCVLLMRTNILSRDQGRSFSSTENFGFAVLFSSKNGDPKKTHIKVSATFPFKKDVLFDWLDVYLIATLKMKN